MTWLVEFDDRFEAEFRDLSQNVQDAMFVEIGLLQRFGPQLGRPAVDTLKGSRFVNMKELRVKAANGVWRIAFAFDPLRQAVLLVAGNKKGANERRFYRALIETADARFEDRLKQLKRRT